MNGQTSIQSCRSGIALDERTGIQLCIARAVWQAHIQHASELAANVALEGKTAFCVANWFSRHSELVLNSTLRRAALQVPFPALHPACWSLDVADRTCSGRIITEEHVMTCCRHCC